MKKTLLLLIVFLVPLFIYSQENTYDYKLTYEVTYKPRLENLVYSEKENMILLTEKNHSVFLSRGTYIKDSILQFLDKSELSYDAYKDIVKNFPKTNFKEKVFKHFSKETILIKEKILRSDYQYEEPLKSFAWIVEDEEKIIGKYHCKKATTCFSGRNYIAWFAEEIPIKDGPYKFSGLPGLIIEVYDTKQHYTYSLKRFEKGGFQLWNVDDNDLSKKIGKKEFLTIKDNLFKDPFKFIEKQGITIEMDESSKSIFTSQFQNRNNPIELIVD